MSAIERLRLTLRVMLEVGVVAALAGWGIHTGQGAAAKVMLGAGVPLVGFGFWGAVDFRRARHAEGLRLLQELAVSGFAAGALYATGAHALGIAVAALSIVYHALVYASGARLLKPVDAPAASTGIPLVR